MVNPRPCAHHLVSASAKLFSTQHRLDSVVGFNDVLAAVRPLPDSLPELPRRVGELEAHLLSTEAEAAAAKRAIVPEMMARETASQTLVQHGGVTPGGDPALDGHQCSG
ncbi:hypothetical protein PI125_g15063 [Phytophthora idaei]|nr:hypothetical protein PI125_g15063 [Phytophthora idaei]